MKPSNVFQRTSTGWCYAGGKHCCSFCCGHLKWSPCPKTHAPFVGHTCISLFFAPPSSHCWMKAQMQKKWVWFMVGGQTSLAEPRHIKPSRPLLLEQVLICGDSEMLLCLWTCSPLSLSLSQTHTHKHVPADLFCRSPF